VTTQHILYEEPENNFAKSFSSAVIPFFAYHHLPAKTNTINHSASTLRHPY